MNFHHEQEKSWPVLSDKLLNKRDVFKNRISYSPYNWSTLLVALFRPTAYENYSDSLTEKTDEAENQSMIHYQSEKLKQNTG